MQNKRPTLQHVDSDIPTISYLQHSEIEEVEAEQEPAHFDQLNFEKWLSELADYGFMLLSAAHNLGVKVDFDRARRLANGHATRSDIFDVMKEVAKNLPDDELGKNLERQFTLWFSLLAHAPHQIDIQQELQRTADKNGTEMAGNYPAIYFQATDKDGHPIPAEEMAAAYEHVRLGLRAIRKQVRRPEGLLPVDHLPHQDLLRDFRNSEALVILRSRLNQ